MLPNGKKPEDALPLKRAAIVFLHLGYWLLYLLLLAVIFKIAGLQLKKASLALLPSLAPLLVLSVAPNLLAFYSFYFPLFFRDF